MAGRPGRVQVLALLRSHGWELPRDPLAHEIIDEALRRWGAKRVFAGLERHLSGSLPSYALEPVGAALGERWECPYQLVWAGLDPAPAP